MKLFLRNKRRAKRNKSERVRKLSALVLAVLVLVNSIGVQYVNATGNVDELRLAVENRLSKFTAKSLSQYGGYLGVFYNMEEILSQAIWVDFAQKDLKKGEQGLQIDVSTVNHYREDLKEFVEKFNEAYGEGDAAKENEVRAFKFDLSWFNDEINLFAICNAYAEYINEYMKEATSDDKASDEDILKKHKKVFRYIYDIIDCTVNNVKSANSFIPYKDEKLSNGAVKRTANYEYIPSNEPFKELYNIMDPSKSPEEQDKDKVSRLLRKAKELTESELESASPDSIDNNLNLLDRFYQNGTYTSQKLINSYYMMFSASAVYDPFVSKVGDDYFKTALMNMSGESEETSELMKLYNEAKMYKKPLYIRDLDKKGNPTGPAERVQLSGFIESIEKGQRGALVLPLGMLAKDRDDNSYNYYNVERFKYDPNESVQNANGSNNGSNSNNNSTSTNGTTGTTNTDTNNTTTTDSSEPNSPDDEDSSQLQDPAGTVYENGTTNNGSSDSTTNNSTSNNNSATQSVENKPVSEMTKEEWEESIKDTQFIPDDTAITNEGSLTPAVFRWGEWKDNGTVVDLGTIVARNIIKDVAKIEKFKKDNRLLFMNAFGDIVTEDDTVIIPGAANPTFYNEGTSFYPYSVGFLKSYPSVDGGTKFFKLQNNNEEGKYVISIVANIDDEEDKANKNNDGDKLTKDEVKEKTIDGAELGSENEYEAYVREVKSVDNLTMALKKRLHLNIQGEMKEMGDGINSMIKFKFLQFDSKSWKNWLNNKVNNARTDDTGFLQGGTYEAFLIKTLTSSISNDSLNVLYASDLENLSAKELGSMAMNYYWGIMNDGNGALTEPNGKLNTELLALYVVPQALNGTANSAAYTKNIISDYDSMVEDTFGRFQIFIRDCVKSWTNTFKDIRGVLGMKSAYQDPIFGKIMTTTQLYGKYVALGVILLVVFRFISSRVSFGQAVMVSGVVALVVYLFTSVIPIYIPMAFNFIQNNATRDLSYIALGMKTEDYEQVYSERYDKDGRLLMSTTSINLYKLGKDELAYFASTLGVTPLDITDGKAIVIDSDAGIYLEGNIIKANVDKLFANHPITGQYVSNGKGGMFYEIKADKMVSSPLDYYTPFNLVMNNLVSKLNDLSKVYQLERSTLKYNGLTKDSFVFDAYTNSAPYLLPGRWEELSKDIEPEVLDSLKEVFGDNYDWLGISTLMLDPPEEAKDSLWYKTLDKNGYLYVPDRDMTSDEVASTQKRIGKAIEKINRLCKVFVEEHREDFKGMSDENIIKIVSLYATTLLSQIAGDWDDALYPMFLNYEEINLEDALVATYSTAYDRLQSESINIVDYIAYQSGIFATLILGVVIFCVYAVTLIVSYAVPVLYVLLGFLLMFKFVLAKDMKGMTKGYIKSTLIIFACYAFSTLSFSIVYNFFKGNVAGLIFQTVVQATILETLFRLILAITTNVGELGNDKMHMVAPLALRATGIMDAVDYLTVKSSEIFRGHKPDMSSSLDDMYDVFKMDSSIDELYDSSFMLRGKVREMERHSDMARETSGKLGTIDLDDLYE